MFATTLNTSLCLTHFTLHLMQKALKSELKNIRKYFFWFKEGLLGPCLNKSVCNDRKTARWSSEKLLKNISQNSLESNWKSVCAGVTLNKVAEEFIWYPIKQLRNKCNGILRCKLEVMFCKTKFLLQTLLWLKNQFGYFQALFCL